MFSTDVPPLYARVTAAPADVTLLELPFGFRDGTRSVGDFTSRTQFYQTVHHKTVMGGYLSRLAPQRWRQLEADAVLYPLALLSEGRTISAEQERALFATGPAMLSAQRVGFVLIDRRRASSALRRIAVAALRLTLLETDGHLELYRTPVRDTGVRLRSAR